MNLTISDLYDLDHTLAADYLRQFTYPWEALAGIGELIPAIGATLPPEDYEHRMLRAVTLGVANMYYARCIIMEKKAQNADEFEKETTEQ